MATLPALEKPTAVVTETPVARPRKGFRKHWHLYAAISPSICSSSASD